MRDLSLISKRKNAMDNECGQILKEKLKKEEEFFFKQKVGVFQGHHPYLVTFQAPER
jgi:hypothetical protein